MPRLKLKSVTRRAKRTLRPVQDVAEQSAQRALLHALGALDAATRRAAQARRTLEALLLRDRPGLHHELALRAAKLGREVAAEAQPDSRGTARSPLAAVGASPVTAPATRRKSATARGLGAVPAGNQLPAAELGASGARKSAPSQLSARNARAAAPEEQGTVDTAKISVARKQTKVKRGQKRRH